jgi:Mrp family chromosome partitioning ATPase/capsular polysaccharide biosynthesis protein
LIGAGVSYLAARSMPRTYLSSVTLIVGDEAFGARVNIEDITTSQRMAAVYAGMVMRQPVMEATIQTLGLATTWHELQTRVLAIRRDNSQLLEIRVTDSHPMRAKAIADELARQLILLSPTVQNAQQLQERRDFVRRQLDALQANIQQAELALAEKQSALSKEISARGVLDLQDEIKALNTKIDSWRPTYANLLTSFEGRSPSTLSVVEPAYVPGDPVSPRVAPTVLMAAVVAGLLAFGAALLIEYVTTNDRFTTADDVTRLLGLSNLGSIAALRKGAGHTGALVTLKQPHSPDAEAFRSLRTTVRFACRGEAPTVLLVTSPGPGEGKSVTSANLAASFAQVGNRTIAVDANLRHPSLHAIFGVANASGLGPLLWDGDGANTADTAATASGAGEGGESAQTTNPAPSRPKPLDAHLVATGIPGLSLLPAGPPPPVSPGELFASPAMGRLMGELRRAADVIIIDSPPALPIADAAILASLGPGVIMVVEAGQTRGQDARQASEALVRAEARLLGTVLSKVHQSVVPYHGYLDSRPAGGATGRVPIRRLLTRGKAGVAAAVAQSQRTLSHLL